MKVKAYLIIAGGAILALFTIPHYFTGYPIIQDILVKEEVGQELKNTVEVIWIFSSIAMFLLGYLALTIGFTYLEGKEPDAMGPIIMGIGIIFFGIYGSITLYDYLAAFVIPGALILIPPLLKSPESSEEEDIKKS